MMYIYLISLLKITVPLYQLKPPCNNLSSTTYRSKIYIYLLSYTMSFFGQWWNIKHGCYHFPRIVLK